MTYLLQTSTPAPVYWPTPTPIPTTAATPVMDFGGEDTVYMLAENLVQGYQQANNYGVMDYLFWVLILFIVLGGIWSIIRRVKTL